MKNVLDILYRLFHIAVHITFACIFYETLKFHYLFTLIAFIFYVVFLIETIKYVQTEKKRKMLDEKENAH